MSIYFFVLIQQQATIPILICYALLAKLLSNKIKILEPDAIAEEVS